MTQVYDAMTQRELDSFLLVHGISEIASERIRATVEKGYAPDLPSESDRVEEVAASAGWERNESNDFLWSSAAHLGLHRNLPVGKDIHATVMALRLVGFPVSIMVYDDLSCHVDYRNDEESYDTLKEALWDAVLRAYDYLFIEKGPR